MFMYNQPTITVDAGWTLTLVAEALAKTAEISHALAVDMRVDVKAVVHV
jgi:hypothetical protein